MSTRLNHLGNTRLVDDLAVGQALAAGVVRDAVVRFVIGAQDFFTRALPLFALLAHPMGHEPLRHGAERVAQVRWAVTLRLRNRRDAARDVRQAQAVLVLVAVLTTSART